MNFKTFETNLGTLVIAKVSRTHRLEDDEFIYTRPQTIKAHPLNYIPYDWVLKAGKRGHQKRIPMTPTKQAEV